MKDTAPPGAELTRFVTYRLSRIQNRLNTQARVTLAGISSVTLTEWRILSIIRMHGETTASDIHRAIEMDKAQASRGVSSLVERGFVAASGAAADGRRMMLTLTEAGAAEHETVIAVMRRRQALLTQDLSAAEMEALFSILDRLEARAQERIT